MADPIRNPDFWHRMRECYDNQAFCDFTIVCKDKEWKTHRILLSAHSEVFAKACHSNFKKEAAEHKIDLSAHQKDEIAALVEYIYTCSYATRASDLTSCLSFDLRMVLLADQFNMKELQEIAFGYFSQNIRKVYVGDEHVEVITMAYGTGGPLEPARQVIVEHINNMAFLHKDVGATERLQAAVLEHPQLALDIIHAMMTDKKRTTRGTLVSPMLPSGSTLASIARSLRSRHAL